MLFVAEEIAILEEEDFFMVTFSEEKGGAGRYCSIQRSAYEEEDEEMNWPYVEVDDQGTGSYRKMMSFDLSSEKVTLGFEDGSLEIGFQKGISVPKGLNSILKDFIV